ncbi:hypothetical protein [Actinomadura sp. DC4]|uniref:hypothetical protein n=1 Tax=Actinomadura sp. DC4 TaxID=3055069 RepID=UPI0025B12F3B|nr:hypothetical protein [Actinomadura sp. DC4]MDN3357475.1 hypothetical protein [Actinomadura sp. DC4]
MRGSIAQLAIPVLAIAPALLAVTPAAHADARPPAADLRMVYENPQITKDNSSITWHWMLTNRGAAGAETVIATHRVSAGQQVAGASRPCTAEGSNVVCRYDTIKPGETRLGWIKTKLGPVSGTMRVSAQVSWHEAPTALPGIDDPSAVDAAPWGVPPGAGASGRKPRQDHR